MNIESKYPITIFRNDNEYGTFYKVGLSKKDMNGNYVSGYKDVRFKKGVEVENKTRIYIKNAWLDFYIKDKKTIDYIFISEFEKVSETIEKAKEEIDPFTAYGETVVIDDNFLD